MREYKFHSKEEKSTIVKRYLAGESPNKLYKETGISDGSIRKWRRQYLAGGVEALENQKKPGNPLSIQIRDTLLLQTGWNVCESMSKAGTPRDNAVMESFFGRFKDVLRFQFRYWEQDDLFAVISKAIHYFNNIRPIRKLNENHPFFLEKNGWLNPAFSVYYLLTISLL